MARMHGYHGGTLLEKARLDLAVAGRGGRERTPGLESHQPGAGRRIARERLACHGVARFLAMPEDLAVFVAASFGSGWIAGGQRARGKRQPVRANGQRICAYRNSGPRV
jgi:hypothetical protein